MNLLHKQWQRLYLMPSSAEPCGHAAKAPTHIPVTAQVRTMVLSAKGPAAWKHLAPVWQGIQTDLCMPAPAVAVNGADSMQLWFSVAEPVDRHEAAAFLTHLRASYLGKQEPQGIWQWPSAHTDQQMTDSVLELVPALQTGTQFWSAYVAPDLASIFADEPWLDVPPNPQAQADILARMGSIAVADLRRCHPLVMPPTLAHDQHNNHVQPLPVGSDTPDGNSEARQFLLDAMRNTNLSMALRIKAAKALL